MSLEIHTYSHQEVFTLESGATLPSINIVFHSSVAPASIAGAIEEGRRVVWICHALTANSDPSEWWSDLVGQGKYFDSTKDIIICANTLGSCYGTTGPAAWDGAPLDFPYFSVRDLVSAHVVLRRHLGIDTIDLLVGSSVGGFQALEWAIMEPAVMSKLILIACHERISPWATAFNESQRMAIEADQTFEQQASLKGGTKGLQAARSMALISYRSYVGYNSTQQEEEDNCIRAQRAATYQRYQGMKLSDRFDAYSYYYMTIMLDTHNVGRNRGGVTKALGSIEAETLTVAIGSDLLFPPSELQYMSSKIPQSKYAEIESAFGHDGFLIEWKALQKVIGEFLGERK
ncbi:MAG: homoserine O-acetyltransferase [Rikenellaceae bacterium]